MAANLGSDEKKKAGLVLLGTVAGGGLLWYAMKDKSASTGGADSHISENGSGEDLFGPIDDPKNGNNASEGEGSGWGEFAGGDVNEHSTPVAPPPKKPEDHWSDPKVTDPELPITGKPEEVKLKLSSVKRFIDLSGNFVLWQWSGENGSLPVDAILMPKNGANEGGKSGWAYSLDYILNSNARVLSTIDLQTVWMSSKNPLGELTNGITVSEAVDRLNSFNEAARLFAYFKANGEDIVGVGHTPEFYDQQYVRQGQLCRDGRKGHENDFYLCRRGGRNWENLQDKIMVGEIMRLPESVMVSLDKAVADKIPRSHALFETNGTRKKRNAKRWVKWNNVKGKTIKDDDGVVFEEKQWQWGRTTFGKSSHLFIKSSGERFLLTNKDRTIA